MSVEIVFEKGKGGKWRWQIQRDGKAVGGPYAGRLTESQAKIEWEEILHDLQAPVKKEVVDATKRNRDNLKDMATLRSNMTQKMSNVAMRNIGIAVLAGAVVGVLAGQYFKDVWNIFGA